MTFSRALLPLWPIVFYFYGYFYNLLDFSIFFFCVVIVRLLLLIYLLVAIHRE